MTDVLYKKFIKRWEEVMDLPPQTLGPLTPLYKLVTKHLKVMPISALLVVSLVCVVGIYILYGSTITLLVSILQRGF